MKYKNIVRRILAVTAAVVMVAGTLAGCSGEAEAGESYENYAPEITVVSESDNIIEGMKETDDGLSGDESDTAGESDAGTAGDGVGAGDDGNYAGAGTGDTWEAANGPTVFGNIPNNYGADNEETSQAGGSTVLTAGSVMEVHFIDVGQGDATLVICDGEAMIVDAGDEGMDKYVYDYITGQGVTRLKYAVASHPDADHIGGLDMTVAKLPCDFFLMPNDSKDTKAFANLMNAVNKRGYKILIANAGDTYTLGSASFEILSPVAGLEYEDTNNNSIVMRIDHGSNSVLMTGDALVQPQQTIVYDIDLNGRSNVVKVPHHGADSAYMKGFYDEVQPEYAVISCGINNHYGHPDTSVLSDLRLRNTKLFRTDLQGTIICKSDGTNLAFNVAPTDNFSSGDVLGSAGGSAAKSAGNSSAAAKSDSRSDASAAGAEAVAAAVAVTADAVASADNNVTANVVAPAAGVTYVYNKNTGKFHKPSCSSVDQMSPKNREDLSCTRDELLALYPAASPCGRCHP